MRNKIIVLVIFIASVVLLRGETPLFWQLQRIHYQSLRERDQNLTLTERLDRWFPRHFRLILDGKFFLTTPYFQDFRSDFIIEFEPFVRGDVFNIDTTATYTENEIILRTGEVIPAHNLTEQDFVDIKSKLSWLTTMFRTLGTPVPELMITVNDEVETWVIVNEDSLRQKVILPSFADTVRRLNSFYAGNMSYFRFNEIRKINDRLEFFGHIMVRDEANDVTDFIDIRFHTNRQNEINLVMLFIYREV